MIARKPFAAFAALALAAAPVAATPPPAPERVEGSEIRGGTAAYVLLPIVIVIALLIAITKGDGEPESP